MAVHAQPQERPLPALADHVSPDTSRQEQLRPSGTSHADTARLASAAAPLPTMESGSGRNTGPKECNSSPSTRPDFPTAIPLTICAKTSCSHTQFSPSGLRETIRVGGRTRSLLNLCPVRTTPLLGSDKPQPHLALPGQDRCSSARADDYHCPFRILIHIVDAPSRNVGIYQR